MTLPPLHGRVAIVSGANHGIGAATAAVLARLGADVAVTFLSATSADPDPGDRAQYRAQREQGPELVVAAVEKAGRQVHAIEADLTDADAPARVFAAADVIGWLCTDAARLVTGNILRLR
jgi:3-oxoacyl-[acyl-carrier protein] reductase